MRSKSDSSFEREITKKSTVFPVTNNITFRRNLRATSPSFPKPQRSTTGKHHKASQSPQRQLQGAVSSRQRRKMSNNTNIGQKCPLPWHQVDKRRSLSQRFAPRMPQLQKKNNNFIDLNFGGVFLLLFVGII